MNSLQKRWMASLEACSTQEQAPSYFTVVNQVTGLSTAITNSSEQAHFLAGVASKGRDPHQVKEHVNWPLASPELKSMSQRSTAPKGSFAPEAQQPRPKYASTRNCRYLMFV